MHWMVKWSEEKISLKALSCELYKALKTKSPCRLLHSSVLLLEHKVPSQLVNCNKRCGFPVWKEFHICLLLPSDLTVKENNVIWKYVKTLSLLRGALCLLHSVKSTKKYTNFFGLFNMSFASLSPKEFFPGFPHLFFMNSLGRFWSIPHQFFGTLSDLVFLLTEAHSYETRRRRDSKFQVPYVLLLRHDVKPLPNHPITSPGLG